MDRSDTKMLTRALTNYAIPDVLVPDFLRTPYELTPPMPGFGLGVLR